jgi:beta-glucosidase/6-phospho-beta-glucosidase/beta-galactosidase
MARSISFICSLKHFNDPRWLVEEYNALKSQYNGANMALYKKG